MIIKPIKNEDDYRASLVQINSLGDPIEGSEAYDLLDVLVTLVESYEAKHCPIGLPDPIDAIEYEMEKRGLTRQNLEEIIGPSGRVSEVMNRQRPLTVTMMRRLHAAYQISPEVLMRSYPLNRAPLSQKSVPREDAQTVQATSSV